MRGVIQSVSGDDDDTMTKAVSPEIQNIGCSWLLPKKRHPYYVVTPQYTHRSAGIKALHMLCNALNRAGERAYIVTYPYSPPERATDPGLLTPLLTNSVILHDYENGLTPIVIYPESVSGNLYEAPFVVRYVMNFPGLLGGDSTYSEDEFIVAYSQELATAVPNTRMSLFIPVSDPAIFTPAPRVPRSGSCFYAGKYREVHGGKLSQVTRDSVEIHRQPPLAQAPEQFAALFRRSAVFYTYENTALVIEALMCECPVVFLPNPHLRKAIAARELGWDGISWGTDADAVARAKATVKQARENYLRTFSVFAQKLGVFVSRTQAEAAQVTYRSPVDIEFSRAARRLQLLAEKVEIFFHIRAEQGISTALGVAMRKIFSHSGKK